MLSLPPHTSHRMHPLDVTFLGPLKAAFRKEYDIFIKNYAIVKITPYDIAELFNKSYCRVATLQKVFQGFLQQGFTQ